MPIVQIKLRFW